MFDNPGYFSASLAGNVPLSLLFGGSLSEEEEYCKKLKQVCRKNDGFIFTTSTTGCGEIKIENITEMIYPVDKYGLYQAFL
jgi:uroporphyrinogen-III decarboxylase